MSASSPPSSPISFRSPAMLQREVRSRGRMLEDLALSNMMLESRVQILEESLACWTQAYADSAKGANKDRRNRRRSRRKAPKDLLPPSGLSRPTLPAPPREAMRPTRSDRATTPEAAAAGGDDRRQEGARRSPGRTSPGKLGMDDQLMRLAEEMQFTDDESEGEGNDDEDSAEEFVGDDSLDATRVRQVRKESLGRNFAE